MLSSCMVTHSHYPVHANDATSPPPLQANTLLPTCTNLLYIRCQGRGKRIIKLYVIDAAGYIVKYLVKDSGGE